MSAASTATLVTPSSSSFTFAKMGYAAGPSTPTTPTSPASTLPALRGMYQRAARAFLQRNTSETQELIEQAFKLLGPPASSHPDALSSQRRKWDILRITLETTLYTSPASTPSPTSPGGVGVGGDTLRSNLLLSPPSLLGALHTRSLRLFTPHPTPTPSPAFLPAQILVSLVLASLKLECPHVGRSMIEEWLARRIPAPDSLDSLSDADGSGYAKVVDVYCLHVLPRLGEWDYAAEFLRYEVELPVERRSQITETLKRLHIQSQIPASPPPPYHSKLLPPDGNTSEHQLSRVSSSSSVSTHTAVPATPRPDAKGKGKETSSNGGGGGGGAPSLDRPASRASTAKPRPTTTTTNLRHVVEASSSQSSSSSASPPNHAEVAPTATKDSGGALLPRVHTYLAVFKLHYLPMLKAKIPFLVCFVLPILVLVAQFRRRRPTTKPSVNSSAAIRKKLGSSSASESVWAQAWRAVQDTVVMAGRGLV